VYSFVLGPRVYRSTSKTITVTRSHTCKPIRVSRKGQTVVDATVFFNFYLFSVLLYKMETISEVDICTCDPHVSYAAEKNSF
jgi:hypothetical protein